MDYKQELKNLTYMASKMRQLQRDYFNCRTRTALIMSKIQEREVDNLIHKLENELRYDD